MRRSRLFLLAGAVALMLALTGFWQWGTHQGDGRSALERGLAAMDKGDMRAARIELMNAIKQTPRAARPHAAQARVLVELGDGAGARTEAERARALGQPPSATRVAMAEALLLQGDAQAALNEAQASDIPPADRVAADRAVARALLVQGRFGDALAALEHALVAAPRDARTWVDLGRLQWATGNQAAAITAADRAVALAPSDVRALTLRGELTRSQYGLTAALPWFERALSIDKSAAPTLEQYAATLADAGRAGEAVAVTRRLLAVSPGNPRAWMIQAVIAARGDEPDLARALVDRARSLHGEPATRLLRGILQMQRGNAVLAVEMLGPLVAEQPDNRTARTLLGRAYYLAGDFASAATTLAPIVALRDAEPYVLMLAARAQEALGDGAMAADMLVRAQWPVRADSAVIGASPPAGGAPVPGDVATIRSLLDEGRAADAVDRAGLLTRAAPGDPDPWLIRGDALAMLGRPVDAARAYEAAASIRFDRTAALRLTSAWAAAGDSRRAEAVARLFIAQYPASPDALRLNAALALRRHDWRNARRALTALGLQTGPNDAALMADMARSALAEGEGAKASAYARVAYRLMPGNAALADLLAQSLLQSGGSRVEARDLLEKAIAMQPDVPLYREHWRKAG